MNIVFSINIVWEEQRGTSVTNSKLTLFYLLNNFIMRKISVYPKNMYIPQKAADLKFVVWYVVKSVDKMDNNICIWYVWCIDIDNMLKRSIN